MLIVIYKKTTTRARDVFKHGKNFVFELFILRGFRPSRRPSVFATHPHGLASQGILRRGEEGLPPLTPLRFSARESEWSNEWLVNSHPKIGTKQPWVEWGKDKEFQVGNFIVQPEKMRI
jgi:hypothetical protein